MQTNTLKLTWYSPELYAIDFKLIGIQKDNNGNIVNEHIVLDIKNNKPQIINELAVNSYVFDSSTPYDQYKFVVFKANQQNRLLLRELTFATSKRSSKDNSRITRSINNPSLEQLNQKVHKQIIYGEGKNHYKNVLNGKDYQQEILVNSHH